MKVSAALSRKMNVLYVAAIVSVAIIHSRNFTADSPFWLRSFEEFVALGLAQWAVPFFFMASGYWFGVRNTDYSNVRNYLSLIEKKFRVLLIPYVFWIMIGSFFSLVLVLANNFLGHKALLERTPFAMATSLWEWFDIWFGVTRMGPWGEGVMWFVRTLMFFFLLAPIWCLFRKLGRWLPILLGLSFLYFPLPEYIPRVGCGWCLIGMSFAYFDLDAFTIHNRKVCWLVVVILGSAVFCCAQFSRVLVPVVGIPFFWFLYDCLNDPKRPIPSWFRLTFWIFCTHQLIAAYFIAVGRYLWGENGIALFCMMLVTPIVSICGAIISAWVVRRYFPRGYEILSGGRV